eukprot:Sspe_Gene.33500::Locus_16354_Transcript_2_2_Confidence_0.667_Length_1068::g.33500::m.33500
MVRRRKNLQQAVKRFARLTLTREDWVRVGEIGEEIKAEAAKDESAGQSPVGEAPVKDTMMSLSRSTLVDLLKDNGPNDSLGQLFTRIGDRVFYLKTTEGYAKAARRPVGVGFLRGKWWERLYKKRGYKKPGRKEESIEMADVTVSYKYDIDAEKDGVPLELKTFEEDVVNGEIPPWRSYVLHQLNLVEGEAELHIIGPKKTAVYRKDNPDIVVSDALKHALRTMWERSSEWDEGRVVKYYPSQDAPEYVDGPQNPRKVEELQRELRRKLQPSNTTPSLSH